MADEYKFPTIASPDAQKPTVLVEKAALNAAQAKSAVLPEHRHATCLLKVASGPTVVTFMASHKETPAGDGSDSFMYAQKSFDADGPFSDSFEIPAGIKWLSVSPSTNQSEMTCVVSSTH